MKDVSASLRLRTAADSELESVYALLRSSGLPVEGVKEHFSHFIIAETGTTIVGSVGLEFYGGTCLLRSLAVSSEYRHLGIGGMLVDAALLAAERNRAKKVILLTETAEKYFRKWGFRVIDAKNVWGGILASTQFTGTCHLTAVCMEKNI